MMAITPHEAQLMEQLPDVRGTLTAHQALAPYTWFRVGGPAEIFFRPADAQDLVEFLQSCPETVPVMAVGVGSNLLVRDGGVDGVVIRLGTGFTHIMQEPGTQLIRAGAAALDAHVAEAARKAGVSGLEFFRGIPGTIGGALTMNAGAYGTETKDVLVEATGITRSGEVKRFAREDFDFAYRHASVGEDVFWVDALFEGVPGDVTSIAEKMAEISERRGETQPVRERTGGSTFKNPDPMQSDGRKAWELIDAAGCRGLRHGGAMVSEQHCNFLINTGTATAGDIETLGEMVRDRVRERSGVVLEWEIRRIGHLSERQARGH